MSSDPIHEFKRGAESINEKPINKEALMQKPPKDGAIDKRQGFKGAISFDFYRRMMQSRESRRKPAR